ncbi:MAG: aryl-sulfate sulfotransferase [Ignavibacteriae bacterium]|nr:aryl-sulfate sulfotransferase [Ignavibacteriota bacterium]
MKALSLLVFLCCASVVKPDVIYLDPVPDAKYVSIYNGLIIGLESQISESSLSDIRITVTGSRSGIHTGDIKFTSDKKKILFQPHTPFNTDEIVTVHISSNNNQIKYNSRKDFSYSFQTEKARISVDSEKSFRDELGENFRAPFNLRPGGDPPQLTVTISDNPSPGKIFLGSFNQSDPYLIIANNDGSLYYSMSTEYNCLDFKKQYDGTLTFYKSAIARYYQMNDQYQIIDSFTCGNGYSTDGHELVLLPNGHALLMSYDNQIINMSLIVPGGDTSAWVVGLVVQELDENKNVVFQWRSWDHFQITDATHEDMTVDYIDYVHGNAIEPDLDGNLLISSRHMDEITKIDRTKGTIIWRLGGQNNEFTFTNDTMKFSHQHDVRRLADGHITLFDNGNYHSPQFSRAVEYELDEVNKTATLVWEYKNTPTIYGSAMGSVRRLENGNTLIGWGTGGATSATLDEITPDGSIALEMKLDSPRLSYRAFKFEWDSPTSTGNNNGLIPESYSLSQNYPNPFNPVTSISYSIPAAGNVTIKVYDVMGREVSSLVNEYKQAGSYNVTFGASNLASGVYIYKIESGNFIESKKMVLMK